MATAAWWWLCDLDHVAAERPADRGARSGREGEEER